MGRKCCVPECLSEEGRYDDRGVTFHKIPLHSDIRPKWLTLCHIPEDKHNCKVIHVCSRHFLKVNFCRFKGKKYMLRQGVLPSVFPWSKLKKELNDTSLVVKKETDAPVTLIKTELNPENVPFQLKIKEEPCEVTEEKQQTDIFSENTALTENKPSQLIQIEQSSTTIEQKGKSIQTPLGVLNFAVNTQLEALDFNQMWFPAHIVEIDYEENEVLIHFEKYSSKYDEWISMNSSRLRPLQPIPSKILNSEVFVEGEKVMASWNDSRKFPATVRKVKDSDTYEVVFNDGFVKILKGHRMAKTHGRIGSAPLFDPVTGSKQDRREKKRKLNVAQLFRKRMKMDSVEDSPITLNTQLSGFNSSGNEDVDNWMPRWENGRPVGVESVIETNDGVRKSIILPDPRLPPNWTKHLTQRTSGVCVGKWDNIIVSPEGRRFRTRTEIKTFIDENPHLNLNESMFDFSLYRRSRLRRLAQHTESTTQQSEPSTPEEPQRIENPNYLKILLVDDAYKCPIEGCEKSFRRENLAQMHVKHYHPKFTKFLDSTPNVADLAYARTVGDSLDKSPDRVGKLVPPKLVPRIITPKAATPKPILSSPSELEIKTPQPEIQNIVLPKPKDSEILKLLNNKSEEESIKFPPGLPSSVYPVFKLKDLLSKSEGIPKRDDVRNINTSARQTGIKTLLPVIRSTDTKKDKLDDINCDQDPSKNTPVSKPFKHGLKRKRFISDNSDAFKSAVKAETENLTGLTQEPQIQQDSNLNYIVEGGEVIKIVRMRREEIINCTCGIKEEDGLMIQCELCLCWQHAYCNNIERENQVPEKYICYICQNPMRQRSSKKYFHDQDWLKNGVLPVGNYHCKDEEMLKNRFDLLKKSHDLSGLLVELADYMHTLKVKLKIAETKNHQKLYLWSKPWEKSPLPEKIETKPKLTDPQSDSALYSILKTEKPDQSLSKLDFNTLMDTNLEQLSSQVPIIPQPEEAIDSTDCKLNLLDHIAHSQGLIEERLNNIEEQVDALDSGNPTDEDFNKTCQTVQMLLKDLGTLQDFSQNNSL